MFNFRLNADDEVKVVHGPMKGEWGFVFGNKRRPLPRRWWGPYWVRIVVGADDARFHFRIHYFWRWDLRKEKGLGSLPV